MTSYENLVHLSPQIKVYLLILHSVVLGLFVYILVSVFNIKTRGKACKKDHGEFVSKTSTGCVRTVNVDGKRVTVESCQWINTILNWLQMNTLSTPGLVKIWLTMLNEKLKNEKGPFKFKINGIVPGSLPPNFTNVYCSNEHGKTQCIALHIEASSLGFYISLFDNNNLSAKSSSIEVNITKLSGELIFQVVARQSHYDLTVKFIGDPELKVSSSDISEDSERSSIEEKLKDVICKTVVNIPLTESRPGDVSNAASSVPQSSSSCLDSEGKLLVKVIKASGLSGKDETDIPDPYCIITCREPRQKKKTVALKGTKDPFWNESHELDISKKTKEIAFDIYDELKTSEGKNFHMNGVAGKSNDTDSDFLGQVIVPIAMISKDQPCRLILPVLPISEKSSYVTGQISLEFTYDKDGKAFEASQQARTAPLESSTQAKTTIAEESTKESPQKLVFSMATLDIVEDEDDQLHLKPLEDHGVNREDIVMAERRVSERLPLSSSDETAEENDEVALRENEKHKEMLQELIEVERRTCEHDRLNYEEEAKDSEREVANDRPASREPGQSPVEVPPCRIIITPSSQQSPSSPQSIEEDEDEATSHVDVDQKMLDDLTPGTRRKVFREAFSMRINRITQQSSEDGGKGDERKLISHTENRHETADDETTPKSKSFSEVSLTSLYEGTKSVLVVETKERGEVKYYQIPPLMAKRGTFDYKGTKLHVCNDHLFVASHFSGTLPSCYVCKSPLTGYFGKQGYECRDCKMVTHKRCHLDTSRPCPKTTLSSLEIITPEEKSE